MLREQASARVAEVLGWPEGRACPLGRLREAWVAHRYGLQSVVEAGGAAAGPMSRTPAQSLWRAIGLYDAYATQRPAGWPERGPAAVCALASQRRAYSLAGDAARLLLLAKAMGAAALERDAVRLASAKRRAERRQAPRAVPFAFRLPRPRLETADQRRRRVRDAVLLAGPDCNGAPGASASNPALWPNAELALRHIGALAAARDTEPSLVGREAHPELDGVAARAARYRAELTRDLWQLPHDWSQLPTPRRTPHHDCQL